MLDPAICARALESRDPRFDGVFFVGISTTMIYCRPICPSRLSRPDRRSYFATAAAAERHGYRPCLRCRPELAPGRAAVDAVSRIARAAAARIAAGALNGTTVTQLAAEIGVSERHLRRAMEREMGVSPAELAQTQRLLLAKCLLTDTRLPVTQVAYASGFQSLRRFHAVFRERYRMPPTALRLQRPRAAEPRPDSATDTVRLRLPYRTPLAWRALLDTLAAEAQPGVEQVEPSRYARTVRLGDCSGTVFVQESPGGPALLVDITVSLLPALMSLLARLRHLFDLDAEPGVVDAHLARGGLGALVHRLPGVRVPGAFDGFEAAMRELLRSGDEAAQGYTARVIDSLGEPLETGSPALCRLWPDAARVSRAGAPVLTSLGVPEPRSRAIVAVAHAVSRGTLRLEPGADFGAAVAALVHVAQLDDVTAETIAARALHWPDSFPGSDQRAEQWRPWRSYAAAHFALDRAHAERRRTPA
ncbi:MAG: helix-turn-helix domain-containing protein [Gemmatimonadota bacterium]|nr:helix-turn-helix domain-containing protein [Gemmatimonadota bacterium]